MLRNYIKITLAVLWRNKFFTFISLFGISLTLATLMVATSLADHTISPQYPELNRDRILYITGIKLYNTQKGEFNAGGLSPYFCNHYLASLKTQEAYGFGRNGDPINTYLNNKKIALVSGFTDEGFWKVMSFHFLEGKPYSKADISNAEKVVVISEKARDDYYGTAATALGKDIVLGDDHYRVIGVVQSNPPLNNYTSADVYFPYTLAKEDWNNQDPRGSYRAFILAPSKAAVSTVQDEFYSMAAKIPLPDKDYDYQFIGADTYLTSFVRAVFNKGNVPSKTGGTRNSTGMTRFFLIIGGLIFLFMLLPTISLININITRILERSSEIGVRKSFGASSRTLVYQFIIENIILTMLGGVIGIVLTLIVLHFLNASGWIEDVQLDFNIRVLTYSLLFCLLFGLLSGVYPAWRMSRMQIIEALKA